MGTNGNGNGNGNSGWRGVALSALFAVLLAVAGWTATDSQTARNDMRADIVALQKERAADAQRIATLEEGMRQLLRYLDRIESGVDELRRRR